jgi:hypothetical protein
MDGDDKAVLDLRIRQAMNYGLIVKNDYLFGEIIWER